MPLHVFSLLYNANCALAEHAEWMYAVGPDRWSHCIAEFAVRHDDDGLLPELLLTLLGRNWEENHHDDKLKNAAKGLQKLQVAFASAPAGSMMRHLEFQSCRCTVISIVYWS